MKEDIHTTLIYSAIALFVHFLLTLSKDLFSENWSSQQAFDLIFEGIPDWDLLQEIASWNFDATLQSGTKEKSVVYGQLYNYLRYPDLHAKASASFYHLQNYTDNHFYLHIHLSDNLNKSWNGLEVFKNMSMFIKIIKPDIELADKYIELDSKNNNDYMTIENNYMLVKNSIYLSIFIDPNSELISKRYWSSIALDISIKDVSIRSKLFSDIKIVTENSFYLITSTIFIVIFMIIYWWIIFNITRTYLHSWNISPVYSDIFVTLLLSPIAFYISQFELSILREVCPLSINVLLYLFANVLVFILSWILTFGELSLKLCLHNKLFESNNMIDYSLKNHCIRGRDISLKNKSYILNNKDIIVSINLNFIL